MRIYEESDNLWRIDFTAPDFPEAKVLESHLPHIVLPQSYKGSSEDLYLARLFASAIKNGNSIVVHIDSIVIQTNSITQMEVVMQRFSYFSKIESRISQRDIMQILDAFSMSEESLCYYLATVIMTLHENDFYTDERWMNEFIVGGLLTAEKLPDYDKLANFAILGLILKDKSNKKYQGPAQGVAMWSLLEKNSSSDVVGIIRDKVSNGARDINELLSAINSLADIKDLVDLPALLLDELLYTAPATEENEPDPLKV